jgi:hypothetical protein
MTDTPESVGREAVVAQELAEELGCMVVSAAQFAALRSAAVPSSYIPTGIYLIGSDEYTLRIWNALISERLLRREAERKLAVYVAHFGDYREMIPSAAPTEVSGE